MNRILYLYLSGSSLTIASKIFYPLLKRHENHFSAMLPDLKKLSEAGFYFGGTISAIAASKTLGDDEYASVLFSLIKEFYSNSNFTKMAKILKRRGKVMSLTFKTDSDWAKKFRTVDEKAFDRLSAMFSECPYVESFFVHGSYATLDYIKGWSDLDTFLVIDIDKIKSSDDLKAFRKKCLEFRRISYRYDPLQHHGIMLAVNKDFAFYDNSILPAQVFKFMQPLLLRKKNYKITVLPGNDTSAEMLADFSKSFLFGKRPKTPYSWKLFYHKLALMPALYLQARHGKYLYKRCAFDEIKKIFSDTAALDKMTNIRRDWVYRGILTPSIVFWNPFVYPLLVSFLHPCLARGIRQSNKEIVEDARRFAVSMLRK